MSRERRAAKDPFEIVLLATFAAMSVWVLAVRVWWSVADGRVWTGVNGVYVQDVTQYLGWIRDASQHVLVSDLFVLGPTPHDFLQPAVAISGGLVALGMAPWLALLVWQPVAVGGVFLTVRALVHDRLNGRLMRRAALAIALFGGSPGTFQDLWLPWWTWGYTFGVLSLAATLGSLVLYSRGGRVWPVILLAGLASWLHPWQGEVLALVLVGAEWLQPGRIALTRLLPVLTAIALPLAYYAVLDRADSAWRLAGGSLAGGLPVSQVGLMLAPLALPALLAYRIRPRSFTAAAVRVWTPAAFAVYMASKHGLGNDSMHAFLGISVPLAILAVEGVETLRWPARTPRRVLAALAVLSLTVPVSISELTHMWAFVRASRVGKDDWRAVRYLAKDPQPGGVLTAFQLGRYIPAQTGRRTYIGQVFWTQPYPHRRQVEVARLLAGRMNAMQAIAFVSGTHARFLLARCGSSPGLRQTLAPIVQSARRFGCATVFEIKPERN